MNSKGGETAYTMYTLNKTICKTIRKAKMAISKKYENTNKTSECINEQREIDQNTNVCYKTASLEETEEKNRAKNKCMRNAKPNTIKRVMYRVNFRRNRKPQSENQNACEKAKPKKIIRVMHACMTIRRQTNIRKNTYIIAECGISGAETIHWHCDIDAFHRIAERERGKDGAKVRENNRQ